MKKYSFFALIFAIFISISANVMAANVYQELSHKTITDGETVDLYLRYENEDPNGEPDLSPLNKDFDILGKRSGVQSSYVNGKSSIQYNWAITLLPKKSGSLTIPAIKIGNEQTSPLTLKVTQTPLPSFNDPENLPDIFITSEVDNEKPYVNQQVIYTVKLYDSVGILNSQISEPTSENALIQRIGKQKRYQQVLNNKPYIVIEWKYAISPQKQWDTVITPVSFNGRVNTRLKPNIPLPDRFFKQFGLGGSPATDPFWNDFFGSPKSIHLKSKEITLDVKPKPEDAKGKWWIPAKNLEFLEGWKPNPPEFEVGKAIQRTIAIRAVGVSASQLPDIKMPNIEDVKIYPGISHDQDDFDGENLTGLKQQLFAIVPTKKGKITLPEMSLDWWDNETGQHHVAKLEKKEFMVKANGLSDDENISSPMPKDDTPKETFSKELKTSEKQVKTADIPYKYIIAFILALLAFLIIFKSNKAKNKDAKKAPEIKDNTKQIAKACRENDAKKVQIELMNWAKIHWAENPPNNLAEIADRLTDDDFNKQVADLNKTLYAGTDKAWDGEEFYKSFDLAFKKAKKQKAKSNKEPKIPNLYPS